MEPPRTERWVGDVSLVLWRGDIGGAERLAMALAQRFRERGLEAHVVFVTQAALLGAELDLAGVPFHAAGYRRGSAVLAHPRKFARFVSNASAGPALLVSPGFLGLALKVGGFRGRIVGVEHGQALSTRRRLVALVNRFLGRWSVDKYVVVSDWLKHEVESQFRGRDVQRIYNGVSVPAKFVKRPSLGGSGELLRVKAAGRLVPGKGFEVLLQALDLLSDLPLALQIAGDGPERDFLTGRARALGLSDDIFVGWQRDMCRFWCEADIAVVPSNELTETFGLTAVEAMAQGRPVIVTRNGGLAEVVTEKCGIVVDRGDATALADAIRRYATDRDLRAAHGEAGHARCRELFDIEIITDEYAAALEI